MYVMNTLSYRHYEESLEIWFPAYQIFRQHLKSLFINPPQLSSRNANGETPFMTSIVSQNYAAALRILDYLEEWSTGQSKKLGQQLQGQWNIVFNYNIA